MAFLNWSALQFVPDSQADLGVDLALALVPGDLLAEKLGYEITGMSKHAINQLISRDGVGVATKAVLDAIKNPVKIVSRADGSVRIIGRDAAIVLSDTGHLITAWATRSAGWRIIP